ncbi:enoyl-CoA hydratase/isomerase family protein [Pseudonocardia sp. TRM90224]|uniref:enoyl-CoA hydratase/isomerase family protein n=1 Tax=Pseudonocardia sp. TRM90224 TaxID=2812678 RepID=UPI001E61F111|nr:enoyl-CoA hydratase/isomerase family protein [Pseudonocardia sp. TRM90224]
MTNVRIERRADIAVLTLDRPEKLNALSTALEQALLDAIDSDDVRTSAAVVIAGEGRAFSAGADLTEVRELGPAQIAQYYRGSGRVYEAVAALPQVTVAAVHGYCLGGGFELALAADLRVADGTAVFGLPEVGIGIVPSSGGLARLVRMVGPAKARELVLLGRRYDAAAVDRLGLLTDVVPAGGALDAALAVAAEAAAQPALAAAVAKQVIDVATESSHAAALALERLAYGMLNQVDKG